ncbi:hypothetical protein [Pseudoxanthomonas putridarboris]|uniref:YD repeat-containing protein n=1 Tax=Pseudoxanthomonas putridarboris TaxID=752605 RepID=A0ABU9J3W1_9GAMM
MPTETSPYEDRLTAVANGYQVQAFGSDGFGDEVNPLTGDLRFTQVDLELKGVGPDISIIRTFSSNEGRQRNWHGSYFFGDWNLEVPRVVTHAREITAPPNQVQEAQWQVSGTNPHARCSNYDLPPEDPLGRWWNGVEIRGVSSEGTFGTERLPLLKRGGNPISPSMTIDGVAMTFPMVTTSLWMVACLPSITNGPGEGFLAVSPSGTIYWFNYMVKVYSEKYSPPYSPQNYPYPQGYTSAQYWPDGARRVQLALMPSRIRDRFGNEISFTYSNNRLQAISSSDGRSISITTETDHRAITVTSDNPAARRVWRYYTGHIPGTVSSGLLRVVRPDGTYWQFSLGHFTRMCDARIWQAPSWDPIKICQDASGGVFFERQGTVKAPSGAVATYVVQGWPMAYTVDPAIEPYDYVESEFYEPVYPTTYSVRSKMVDNLGSISEWRYSYNQFCPGASRPANTVSFDVTNPDGSIDVHFVDNTWRGPHTGQIKKKLLGATCAGNSYSAFREEITSWVPIDQPNPWPSPFGLVNYQHVGKKAYEYLSPMRSRVINQNGASFHFVNEVHDQYGNPTQVKKYSSIQP